MLAGVRTRQVFRDYDYTPYLGPNYKETQRDPNYIPTFICNHTSMLDVEVLIKYYYLAFAAKKSLRKVPVFGLICTYLGCIFISRGASEEKRN